MVRLKLIFLSFWALIVWPVQAQIPALSALPDCGLAGRVDEDDLRVGAVVLNLENGLGCVDSLDERFQVASVMKLFVAGAYLERANLALSLSSALSLSLATTGWQVAMTACVVKTSGAAMTI